MRRDDIPIILMSFLGFMIISALSSSTSLSSFVRAQLTAQGTLNAPYGTSAVFQMAFDLTNRSLYMTCAPRHTIVKVSQISAASHLTPLIGAPWAYSIVAGRNGVSGPASPVEVNPTVATFSNPSGVVGWPQYAVGPYSATAVVTSTLAAWVGLWVADSYNNAVRFVNFGRGDNVTLVAGSCRYGAQDGIGPAASLSGPKNLAWGRFLRSAALEGSDAPAGSWTSVVFISDSGNNCLRQGTPLRNNQTDGFFNTTTTPADLTDMVLNVSTFAGLCGTGGSLVGSVMPWSPMFQVPWGIALVVLPSRRTTTPAIGSNSFGILFVGDTNNDRISMITPLFPSSSRMLTDVYRDSNTAYSLTGITLGRVRTGPLGNVYGGTEAATIELYVGTNNVDYLNVSIAFNDTTIQPLAAAANVTTMRLFASTMIASTCYMSFIRYVPNSTTSGTLVVFSGWSGSGIVLQFYCCLDDVYSEPIDIGGPVDAERAPATRTVSFSVTSSASFSIQQTGGSATPRYPWGRRPASPSASVMKNSTMRVDASRTHVVTARVAYNHVQSLRRLMSPSARTLPHYRPSRTVPSMSIVRHEGNRSIHVPTPTNATNATTIPFSSLPLPLVVRPPGEEEDIITSVPVRTQVVASITSTAALGTSVAGFSTARSLGLLSVAQRCYYLLFHGGNDALGATNSSLNASIRLEFPDSVWPGLRIGDDAVAYERGAAVAGMVAVLTATIVSLVALTALSILLQPSGIAQLAFRLPMMAVVAVAGLLADGAIGGAALVGGAFTLVGLVVPGVVIALVAVAGLRRVAHFDARYLETTAPAHQVEALRAARKGVFGTMFVWFVGIGAWRPPEGAAPKVTMWGLLAPAALTGRYRGPGSEGSEQGAVERACVYYLALDVALAAALSLFRGLLVSVSCVAAAGAMAAVCLASVVALLCLRPMTAPAKNVVAVGLGAGSAVASMVLLVGVVMGSRSIVLLSIRISHWMMTASTAAAVVSVLAISLKFSMHRRAKKLKASTDATTASLGVPMLPTPAAPPPPPPPPPLPATPPILSVALGLVPNPLNQHRR